MKCKCKASVVFLLVLVLLVPLSLSCGGGGGGGKGVTITIGQLTDFTGPGAPAVKTITYITQDIARYYNDENLIPGVKVKIAAYDTQFNSSRIIPGYEWCKDQGAKVVITLFPGDPEVLKPFAERDKVVVAAMGATPPLFEPPGWVFGFSNTNPWAMKTLLQWVSGNVWDYGQGIPKLGLASWSEPGAVNTDTAIKEYMQNYPGKFDYLGAYLAPVGTMAFKGEVERLKDCDYVTSYGMPAGYFLRDLRATGSKARMIDSSGIGSYRGFFVDLLGWESLDGTLTANQSILWNESTPIVDLVTKLLYQYRPSQADEIIYAGLGYVGAAHQVIAILEVLQQGVKNVGAENFNGQAFFDAAINYKTTSPMWEGYPQWGFSQTKRYLVDHHVIYEFSAKAKDLVRITDWLPMVKE